MCMKWQLCLYSEAMRISIQQWIGSLYLEPLDKISQLT